MLLLQFKVKETARCLFGIFKFWCCFMVQGEVPINIGPEMCDRDTSVAMDPTIVACG